MSPALTCCLANAARIAVVAALVAVLAGEPVDGNDYARQCAAINAAFGRMPTGCYAIR